ncbi:hypothetical protein BAE46_10475 [Glaciecola punicea]|nr:hypothetical protein BAE46_10475 [Glaciecola punicea]
MLRPRYQPHNTEKPYYESANNRYIHIASPTLLKRIVIILKIQKPDETKGKWQYKNILDHQTTLMLIKTYKGYTQKGKLELKKKASN